MNHLDAYTKYAEARLQAEQMKEAYSAAHATFKRAETELVDAMLEDDVSKWTDTSGASIGMRRQFTIKCNTENAQEIADWLQLVTGDAEPFKKMSLDKSGVTAFLREKCETPAESPDHLAESNVPLFFDLKTHPTVSVRGWEKKKMELLRE